MGHLRRAWLAALVCLVAALGVAPVMALAATRPVSPVEVKDTNGKTYNAYRVNEGELYVAGVKMANDGDVVYYVSDGTGGIMTEGASAENYCVSWDPAAGTLTLNGATLTKTAWTDLRVQYDTQTYPQDFSTDAVILARRNVKIKVVGNNALTNLRECPGANYTGLHRDGIASYGCAVTIEGEGVETSSLTAVSSPDVTNGSGSKQDWMDSVGVSVFDGTLAVRDLALTAQGLDTTYFSCGIYVDGSATFKGSEVTATGRGAMPASGAVANSWTSSYGMYVGPYSDGTGGTLTVDNTELTVSSGVSYASVGLCAASVEVTGSSVVEASTKTGDGTNLSQSVALYCGDYTIDGGRVVANAGPAKGVSYTYNKVEYNDPGYSIGYEGVYTYTDENKQPQVDYYGMHVVKGSVELTSGEASADGYSVAYEGPTQDFSASDYHATVSYNAEATVEGAEAWTPECDGADQGNGYVLLTGNRYFAVDSSFSPSVSVTWDDLDDLDGIRPDSLEASLKLGDEVMGTVTLTCDDRGVWASAFDVQPVYNAQLHGDYRAADAWEKIPYTVEIAGPEGYAVTTSGDVFTEGGLHFTLSHDVTHDVTFVSGVPGAKDEVQTVAHNGVAVRPADPAYEGWTFLGWYTDKTFSMPYDFETPVTADITLYGGWVEAGEEPGEPSVPSEPTEPGATDGTDEGGLPSTGDPASLTAVLTTAAGALAFAASRRR